MEQSNKDMVLFCLDFVKNNVSVQSQNVQCRNWLKMAMDEIGKSGFSSSDFVISNLMEVDGYFSGQNARATVNTVYDKIDLVKTLIKDI